MKGLLLLSHSDFPIMLNHFAPLTSQNGHHLLNAYTTVVQYMLPVVMAAERVV